LARKKPILVNKEEVKELYAGCFAIDCITVNQFQVWGICGRLGNLLDTEGVWHKLVDCAYVEAGTLSVSAALLRNRLYSKVDWDDGDGRMPIQSVRRAKYKVA
jgi:hypothetical protein